jgi:hypothetical protein
MCLRILWNACVKEFHSTNRQAHMKKSKVVKLVLLGGAFFGCSDDTQNVADGERRVYKSKNECVQEWSDSTLCESTDGDATYSGHGSHMGPYYSPGMGYYWMHGNRFSLPSRFLPSGAASGFVSRGNSVRSTTSSHTSTTSSRGGFGSSSAAHSSASS